MLPAGLTEDDLTAQALAAAPDPPLGPHAQPFRGEPAPGADLLPEWYGPKVLVGRSTPARRAVAIALVAAALLVNALGFCVTYGQLTAG